MISPAIILVAPQLGENIGAAARVMGNFGLFDLRLVAPRDGWPNPAADTMSAGAFGAGVSVTVFDDVEAAVADCVQVLATTARPRGMIKPVLDLSGAIEACGSVVGRAGVLFGAERTGLPNEAVALADAIVSFPVNPQFASLNLGQAVGVFSYGWAAAASAEAPRLQDDLLRDSPATRDELIGMLEHFEEELDRAGFFFPVVKRPVMQLNLRNAFTRAGWTSQEVRTFRGGIKALALGRGKARVVRED